MIASIGHQARGYVLLSLIVAGSGAAAAQEATVRSTAVVDLSFDEAEGPAEDRATAGAVKDSAAPMNGAARVASPFWNVRGGRAARFEAAGNQSFEVADSADVDHTAGTTLSLYFLNLHEPSDAIIRGIAAKRNPTDLRTNYGLNFQPSGKLQLYLNDGGGFKIVSFPVASSFGVRRLTHLTATFRPGDAPEPDADADADDLEIRLFVNGKPIKPQDSTAGPVLEDAGWAINVDFAGLVTDTPLTIGASTAGLEGVNGLIDEFLVFNRSLSTEEAAKLFLEVAGPDGERLAAQEAEATVSAVPDVTEITPRGLQVGATTRLSVTGKNLGPETIVSLLGVSAQAAVLPESTAERLVVDVTVPAEAQPSISRFAVQTPAGISAAIPLPVDRLPQRMIAEAASGEPVALPAAYTGTLKDTDRLRIAFDGKAGQTFVAETELRRLGGGADPVLELKTEGGTPVDLAWGRSERGGDPRLVTKLSQDGRYVLELHDLAYKAPASPFRLLVGDLRLMDAVVPLAATSGGTQSGTAVGVGLDGQSVELAAATGEPAAVLGGPGAQAAQGVLPLVPVSDGRELGEADAAEAIDVAGAGLVPTYVTGRLIERNEVDRFTFRVPAGQAIEVRVEAKSIGSTVEPVVTVLEGSKRLGRQAAQPGTGSVTLSVTPEAVEGLIEVRVADRLDGAGPGQLYRLKIAPAGTPELQVTLLDSSIVLPRSGRGVTRLRVERGGNAGAVKLIPDEASGIVVEPALIRAGKPVEEVFVTISAAPGREIGPTLSLVAEAETPNGPLRRAVRVSPGGAVERFDASRPYFMVPIVAASSAPAVELVRLPEAAFKGVTETVGLRVSGEVPEGYAVRFSLVSDEAPRPNDPKNAAAGTKPLVRLAEDAAVPPGVADAAVALAVPSDVAAEEISAIVKAEVVPHAWSDRVTAVGYSAPLKLAVQEAIAAVEPAGSNAIKAGENQLQVAVRRAEGFAQPVRVELRGLPEGFAAPAVDVPADQAEATLALTVPAGTAAGPVADVELVVLGSDGAVLKSVKPFALEVTP